MIEGAAQKVDFSSLDEEEGPPETLAKVFITKEDLPIPETKEKAYKEIKCMLTQFGMIKPQGIIFHIPKDLDDLDRQKERLQKSIEGICESKDKSSIQKAYDLLCEGKVNKKEIVTMIYEKLLGTVGMLRRSENVNS